MTDLEVMTAGLEDCQDDPALFQDLFLGRELWSKQVEVCNAVAHNRTTLVPAGRAVGKSFLLAGIVLWWLYTRPRSLVITTGPDHRQVVSVLWKEIHRAIRAAPIDLGLDHLTAGYSSPQRLVIDLGEGAEWGAIGFATDSEEGLSGQHAADLLVIVDEASGLASKAWNAIEGLAASRLLVAGNPIKYDCHFRELNDIAAKGTDGFALVPISSLDHPHAGLETSPIGAVCRAFLRDMRSVHGEESPWWKSNILGLFPGQETVRFIPRAWLDNCTRETARDDLWMSAARGQTRMGVDVGGGVGADRSVIVVRNDLQILEIFASEWHGTLDDARHRLEPEILRLAQKWQVPPSRVTYDKAGPGRHLASYVANESEKVRQKWWAVNPDIIIARGEGPSRFEGMMGYFGGGKGGKHYINRRTSCAFALRKRLDPHREGFVPFYCGGLPAWPALREELAELRSPTMEMEEGQVKQRLEDKDELMARLKRSPDILDALLMTFAVEG